VTRLPKDTPVPDAEEPGFGGRAADRLDEFERARGLDDETPQSNDSAGDEQASDEGTVEDESTGGATRDAHDSADTSAESDTGEAPAPEPDEGPDEDDIPPV
jgi:hypothetical protein